jgi:glycosyltransferase involved in cell wall biosynthesis
VLDWRVLDPDRPLEVLHVIESLGHGGAEQNLLSVLRFLPAHRFRNHLAWLYDDERLLESFRPYVASLLPLRAHGRVGLFQATARLARWLRSQRPDVVHTQLVRAQLVGRAGARLARRLPVVTTWQNVFYADQALSDFRHSRLLRAFVHSLDRITGRMDRHFIAVSEHVGAEQSRSLAVDKRRVSVIFNSVAPERYRPVAASALAHLRAELGIANGASVLLAVGRLVEQKGHCDLIECMHQVIARVPGAVLLIVGGGPLHSELSRSIDARNIRGKVLLLGPRNDVAALYQTADLFVFPSRYEGLSVALVEALTNGLPAVVSDLPQNREVAEGITSVRFVPWGNPSAWANAITAALVGPDRLQRTAAADRERLRTLFSSEALSAQFGQVLWHAAGRAKLSSAPTRSGANHRATPASH